MTAGLEVDKAELASAQDLVGRISQDIRTERGTLATAVEGLVGDGWTGAAAEQYAAAWAEWRDGADQLLDALDGISDAMGVARQQLVTSDDHATDRSTQVSSRLSQRLGGMA